MWCTSTYNSVHLYATKTHHTQANNIAEKHKTDRTLYDEQTSASPQGWDHYDDHLSHSVHIIT